MCRTPTKCHSWPETYPGSFEVLSFLSSPPQALGTHSEERDVERGSARRSSLKGRERAIFSQTNIRTVSKATLGKLLRDWMERI